VNKVTFDIGDTFFGGSHFLTSLTGLGTLVSILISNAIVIAGIVFILLIIVAGSYMITGAGSGNVQQVARGREILLAAIIGFLIVIAAYWAVLLVGEGTGLNLLQ
jgi:hypothetical protein